MNTHDPEMNPCPCTEYRSFCKGSNETNAKINGPIAEFAHAVLMEDTPEILPGKVTICSTIYLDLEDCDLGHYRVYPTWAFHQENDPG